MYLKCSETAWIEFLRCYLERTRLQGAALATSEQLCVPKT